MNFLTKMLNYGNEEKKLKEENEQQIKKVEEVLKFECSGCGLCCLRVGTNVRTARLEIAKHKGKVSKVTKAVAAFPFKTLPNGACEKLVDGKCSVYENRPAICNVEKTFDLYIQDGRTKEEFFSANAKLCNQWIGKKNLDAKFLVKEQY